MNKLNEKTTDQLLEALNAWDESFADWDAEEFTETKDTVEEIKKGCFHYKIQCAADNGPVVFLLSDYQLEKGDQREELVVVDLGDKRYYRGY